MLLTKENVINQLKKIQHPLLGKNIIDLDLVKDLLITEDKIFFSLHTSPEEHKKHKDVLETLREQAQKAIETIAPSRKVVVIWTNTLSAEEKTPSERLATSKKNIPGIQYILAVGSAKGGVGKSTTTVNLALTLLSLGLKVGIIDADIYGSSIPHLLGISENIVQPNNNFLPIKKFGLQMMSMGLFLKQPDQPIIWRAPMIVSSLIQMLFQTQWNNLDILLIDLPPGTGDIQLTLAQKLALSGVVIVSTPQDVAIINAQKSLHMFEKLETKIIGMIENMSYFIAPDTKKRYNIFGRGGVKKAATLMRIPFLGSIPLEEKTRELSDIGTPIVIKEPENRQSKIYLGIAKRIHRRIQDM